MHESALAMETVSPAYTEGSVSVDAIENNDASIHFSEHEDIPDNHIVNQALNRLASILYNVKERNGTTGKVRTHSRLHQYRYPGTEHAGAVYQKITKPPAC